jgi:hypothetical protein
MKARMMIWIVFVARMRDEKYIQNFNRKTLREESTWGDLLVNCSINKIEIDLRRMCFDDVDCLRLRQTSQRVAVCRLEVSSKNILQEFSYCSEMVVTLL